MSLKQGSWLAHTVEIPLNMIDVDEANRKTMHNLEDFEADIIRVGGLYYPIIVSPYVRDSQGNLIVGDGAMRICDGVTLLRRFMIFDGERRYVVYKRLGWATIPALIRTNETLMELRELQFATNAKREDMNPVDMAQAIERYIKEFQNDPINKNDPKPESTAIQRIMKLTKWSLTYVDSRRDILQMPQSIQDDIKNGVTGANLPTELLNNIPAQFQAKAIKQAEEHKTISTLQLRPVGKCLKALLDMPVTPEQMDKMSDSIIERGGRFLYDREDIKPDLSAYLFEVEALYKRMRDCWNIKGATVKELEAISGTLNLCFTLWRNMQKEELGMTRIGQLKAMQWNVKNP